MANTELSDGEREVLHERYLARLSDGTADAVALVQKNARDVKRFWIGVDRVAFSREGSGVIKKVFYSLYPRRTQVEYPDPNDFPDSSAWEEECHFKTFLAAEKDIAYWKKKGRPIAKYLLLVDGDSAAGDVRIKSLVDKPADGEDAKKKLENALRH